MAREHPIEGNYGASTNQQGETKRYKNEQLKMPNGVHADFAWAEKAADWICKFSAREEWFTRTSQQSLTGSDQCWSYFEQADTKGSPT